MNSTTSAVITVDGPAASGKSSVSRGLASELGWHWVSTGIFYRGLAYLAHKQGMSLETNTPSEIAGLLQRRGWVVKLKPDATRFLVDGQDVTEDLTSEEIGQQASAISSHPEVRTALLEAQRSCSRNHPNGLVAEGRDCGSVVFPMAPLKVFLTASSAARAQRRADQHGGDLDVLKEAHAARDRRDATRKVAPMVTPDGSLEIDTSEMTIDEVVAQVVAAWRAMVSEGR